MIRALFIVVLLTSVNALAFEDANDQAHETNVVCSLFTAAKHRAFMKAPAFDKYKHCTVSCSITLNCGAFEAMNTGVLKEVWDLVSGGDASVHDIQADTQGVRAAVEGRARNFKECQAVCDQIYPAQTGAEI
ncbi:MAG: hypothetical protein JST80_10815 [Bdellovibrionales bacterium]|nr:hypothetical protein [Bdellovibrionales bacterium]